MPRNPKPGNNVQDVLMDSDDSDVEILDPPPSSMVAPEKGWAKKVNNRDLFASLMSSPERKSSKPTPQAIPLRKPTVGGMSVGDNLKSLGNDVNRRLPVTSAPQRSAASAHPMWSIGSMESIQTSIGFLEEHITSLKFVQECLINHQKVLVRTRTLNQAMLDSISRAMYTQNRYRDLREVLEGRQKGDSLMGKDDQVDEGPTPAPK